MKRLTETDIQHIDTEIIERVGTGKRSDVVDRLRSLAEVHRVFASRAGLLCQDLHDERMSFERR